MNASSVLFDVCPSNTFLRTAFTHASNSGVAACGIPSSTGTLNMVSSAFMPPVELCRPVSSLNTGDCRFCRR